MKAGNSKAGAPARFDITALRKLAGDKVFERGEDYHADGQVEILSLEPERVLAQVTGSDDYRTVLAGRGKKIGGECSCPAFTDRGFCKHMVATALAANQALDFAAAGNGAAVDGAGTLGRIRAHLKTRGVDALVDIIVNLAERDPTLFRKLDLEAATVQGDDKAVETRLRRAIDGATRTGSFVDYHAAEDWADAVAMALNAIADIAAGERAGVALRLAGHAIDRIEQAIESIDDSDGHCSALLEQARDIHLAACRIVHPDPVALAQQLFDRETGSDYDTFYGAAAVYEDVLGQAGLAEYRRHLRLAEFCLQQGRKDEALRWAEEGLWRFEDGRPDERLTLFAAGLLTKAGRKAAAEKHLWRTFELAPSRELYNRLRKLGGIAARDRALALLEATLSTDRGIASFGTFDLLVRLLIKEKMLDAAWSALERRGGGGAELRQALADASKTSHPGKALAVYAKLVEDHAQFGRYEDAVQLVKRMAGLRDAAEQATYVADLTERHKRKRNFMKLL